MFSVGCLELFVVDVFRFSAPQGKLPKCEASQLPKVTAFLVNLLTIPKPLDGWLVAVVSLFYW